MTDVYKPRPRPDLVFIIPYRDRLAQKEFFLRYMAYILEDYDDSEYEIVFCHQNDSRTFNRGAMKNIGFNYVKQTYPTNYKNITLVFNDIDCVPYIKGLLDYKTSYGKVKHFYGFEFSLGGIVSMTCYDFEMVNGFPNYWGWGFEDNAIQDRATRNGTYISRKTFFKIGDNRILHLFDSFKKDADKNVPAIYTSDNGSTGLSTLTNFNMRPVVSNVIINHTMLSVNKFTTEHAHDVGAIISKDIRDQSAIVVSAKDTLAAQRAAAAAAAATTTTTTATAPTDPTDRGVNGGATRPPMGMNGRRVIAVAASQSRTRARHPAPRASPPVQPVQSVQPVQPVQPVQEARRPVAGVFKFRR